ncbi:MAG: hypothetical protein V4726_08505 [Verrucomicrobiota bacterium]
MRAISLILLLAPAARLLAGPYAPAAGQEGSTAIARTDSRFTAWANRVASYQVGANCLPQWRDSSRALGPATDDPTDITCLGDGGSITLAFPGFIQDGTGPDFAVFENSFSDTFLEFAWVEVSSDGVNFVRFPNHSATAAPVTSFGTIDPTDIDGLAGKYRQPFGVPFDLADVGLDQVSHVRLVDILGDGSAKDSAGRAIYDPFPNSGSAGFDLNAVGVLHLKTWQTLKVGEVVADQVNAFAFAHLSDGRLVLGKQGALGVQAVWGLPALTTISPGGVEFDPAFIAVRSDDSALLGAGGGFGGVSGLHLFNPAQPALPVVSAPLAQVQNYTALYWKSAAPGLEGWIIGGTNGPAGKHRLTFISADGTKTGPLTENLCTYSSGLAVDAGGNVFAALYELPGSPEAAESEWVLKFPASRVEAAVSGILAGQPAALPKNEGLRIFQFDSASSLAVDAWDRLWAGGFKTEQLQIYDPSTGASRRLSPDHGAIPGAGGIDCQVKTFSRNSEPYAAFLAHDELGTPGTAILHGITPLSAVTVPETQSTWRAFHFGRENLTPDKEAALWGAAADPDGDGQSNLLEYALHTDPMSPNATATVPARSGGRLTLTFSRDPLRSDLRLTVEAADSLDQAAWVPLARSEAGAAFAAVSPAAPLIAETAAAQGLPPVVTVRDVVSTTSQARRFLRLRVTVLP